MKKLICILVMVVAVSFAQAGVIIGGAVGNGDFEDFSGGWVTATPAQGLNGTAPDYTRVWSSATTPQDTTMGIDGWTARYRGGYVSFDSRNDAGVGPNKSFNLNQWSLAHLTSDTYAVSLVEGDELVLTFDTAGDLMRMSVRAIFDEGTGNEWEHYFVGDATTTVDFTTTGTADFQNAGEYSLILGAGQTASTVKLHFGGYREDQGGADYGIIKRNNGTGCLDNVELAKRLRIDVPENGSNTFTVVVDNEPNNYPITVDIISVPEPNVIISGTPEYDLGVSPASFTLANSSATQVVTLTGDLTNTEIDLNREHILLVTTTDPNNPVDPEIVVVTILDDDSPTITVGKAGMQVAEGGVGGNSVTDTFNVSISQAPVGAAASVQMTVDPTYLLLDGLDDLTVTFLVGDGVTKTVTVTAVDNTENNTEAIPYESYTQSFTTQVTNAELVVVSSDVTILENDCGAVGYDDGDFDLDCDIDLADFATFAAGWLDCNFPNLGDTCP